MKNGFVKVLVAMWIATTMVMAQTSAIWSGNIDAEWYWDYMEQAEYLITTAEQLAGLAQLVNGRHNFSGKTIKLGANIMLNDTTGWEKWGTAPVPCRKRGMDGKTCFDPDVAPRNSWTPIGSYANANDNRVFQGRFDGNGYAVIGIHINNRDDYKGLFAYTGSDSKIENLGIIASFIKEGYNVGSLVGMNYGAITNCYANKVKIQGSGNIGGLIGNNQGGNITNCYAVGSVIGVMRQFASGSPQNIGGLIGGNFDGTITDCYANVNVRNGGGLVGTNGDEEDRWSNRKATSSTIINSYATGNVENGGGLVRSNRGKIKNCYATGNVNGGAGLVQGNYNGKILNCYATGNVENGSGLVGYNFSIIANSYATGNVTTSRDIENVGGLVGTNFEHQTKGKIINCYATGDVLGGHNTGGLVGSNQAIITNSYATGNVSGTRRNGLIGGLVGWNQYIISNSYATGNLRNTGTEGITGGLTGINTGITINSYATGNISGVNIIGGLVGSNTIFSSRGRIINCYSVGKVSGSSGPSVGGLVGVNEGVDNNRAIIGTITASYYDRQISGQVDVGKGIPRSTVQMKQQETFGGWDFEKVWGIDLEINSGYPYLQ